MKPSELIRHYGWVQGRLGTATHGFCLIGALVEARCTGIECEQIRALVGGNCIEWNDTTGRTKDEVLALLEAEGL
jgi:hypothetical protein